MYMKTTDRDGKPGCLCEATATLGPCGGGGGAAQQTTAQNNTALRGTPGSWRCSTGGGEESAAASVAHTRRGEVIMKPEPLTKQLFLLKHRLRRDEINRQHKEAF